MIKSNFYISTGEKQMLYTLRKSFKKFDDVTHAYIGYGTIYLGILSNNKEKAMAKAQEKIHAYMKNNTNETYEIEVPNFDLNQIKRDGSGTFNYSHWIDIVVEEKIFPFGKYKGLKIEDVMEQDAQYCIWFAENCMNDEKYAELKEYILGSSKQEITTVLNERAIRQEKEQEQMAKNVLAFQKYVTILQDGQSGFCDSIAEELKNGKLPKGRGFNIMIDILTKRISNSRKNSKKYKEIYDEIYDELVECLEK